MEHYFDPKVECASREQITAWQNERLVKQVERVYNNVPYYKKKMDELGVRPEHIHGIEDLHLLPTLSKDDLRDQYPYGLMAAPLSDCVRIHSTSGTTGRRVVAFYTQHDVDLWEECCARALAAAGATKDDVVQVCYGYGLFTGGAGLHGGSHKLGSLTLPMSSGNTDRQLQFMTDLGTTVLCCTPSYAAYLAESVNERGLRNRIKLKAGIFGAEAWTEEMRRDIEKGLGLKAYDIYGLTEISGPGVAYECSAQNGMHVNEDHFIVETINPKTGEPVPHGQKGELVFTSLTKEAFPLIRYRTKDIGILYDEPCSCGRTHVRMSKPMGRSDDMLIVKGVNVFPSQIETVLMNCGYPANYQIIVTRTGSSDRIEVQVEMTPEMFSDSLSEVAGREKQLVTALKAMLGIYCVVKLVAPKSITRSEGKAKRVIDKRNLYVNGSDPANRPGALAEFTKILEKSNIDLRALSLAESEDFGIVRVIVDNPFDTIQILKDEGYVCSITKVIAVEIEDKPGALVNMLNILGDNKVNLEYSYAFLAKKANSAFMVFRVADNEKAIRVLTENGIRPICHEDMEQLFK